MRTLFIRYNLKKKQLKGKLILKHVTHKINVVSFIIFYFLFCVFYYLVVVSAPPSVDVSRCKRPLVLNVANPS